MSTKFGENSKASANSKAYRENPLWAKLEENKKSEAESKKREVMEVTENQKEILKHMLGADSRYMKKQWGFRNHYSASLGHHSYDELRVMEGLGLVKSGTSFTHPVFWATKAGALAIGFKPYQLRKTKLAA